MEIEIGRLFRAIRRFWWLPVVGAIVFGLVAGLVNRAMPTTYTATTRVLIVPGEVAGQSVLGGSTNMLIDTATSSPVMQEVIDELGLDMTEEELRRKTVVVMQTGTAILLISVTDPDSERSAEIANTIAEKTEARATEITLNELQAKRDELQTRSNELRDSLISIDEQITSLEESGPDDDPQQDAEIDALRDERLAVAQEKADIDNTLRGLRAQISRSYSDLSVVEAATAPEEEDGLSLVIVAIVGAFVGALLGSASILFLAVRDHTVVNAAQVARITGVPVLRDIKKDSFRQDLRMVLRFVGGLHKTDSDSRSSVSIVAPTELHQLEQHVSTQETPGSDLAVSDNTYIANGVMLDEAALSGALQSSGVVLAVAIGVTTEPDLRRTSDSLLVAGVPVIGNIVFHE